MKNDLNIIIALPERIPILISCRQTTAGIGRKIEEFHLYLENMIVPYLPEWDIQVHCAYGHQYGSYWQLDLDENNFTGIIPDGVTEFPLSIAIYDSYGKKLAEKICTIELYSDEKEYPPFSILTIGDSMTQAQSYLEHIAAKLPNISFAGTRSFNGWLKHEGRGGFSTLDYTTKYQDPYASSPFLFPKGVEATRYFGDQTFWEQIEKSSLTQPYVYSGYEKQQLADGMIYNRDGILYVLENGKEQIFSKKPEWEFHFSKYMERFHIGKIDAVSILLGTNDILNLHYDTAEQGVEKVSENIQTMIQSIQEYSDDVKILLNLPVLATKDEVAFGRCYSCDKHSKETRFIMLQFIQKLIEKWDHSEDQNIYLVPMYAVLDPIHGFPQMDYSNGRYFNSSEVHVKDAIHPNEGGYRQMGDALAASIQKIR